MVLTQTPPLSLEAFLQQPETKPPQEYIEGQIYPKPMPKGQHSRIQTRLATAINAQSEPEKIAMAFTELRCTFGGRSLIPDISVFNWQNIPLNPSGQIADLFLLPPTWTIEILSPEQPPIRVMNNILFCLDHGSELGWLIDPQEQAVATFQPGKQLEIYQGDRPLPTLANLPQLQFSPATIFNYLNL